MKPQTLLTALHLIALCYTHAQLSFEPADDFYDVQLGTDLNVSCLFNGVVNNRVRWLEDSLVISSNHQLSLTTVPLGHHEILCVHTPSTGSNQTKQLTVNVYDPVYLEFLPALTSYSFSTRLSNSTPVYLYCIGYGNPSPIMEWREDSVSISSVLPTTPTLPQFHNASIAAIDIKLFSPGSHQLSCYGFNGYTDQEILLSLTVDSSSPLLVSPAPNSTIDSTPIYLLSDAYTNISIHCTIKLFSLSPDDKWIGVTPFWVRANGTDRLSSTSSIQLSNETLGDIACVLIARDNSSMVQRVQVAFVNPPTPRASSTSLPLSSVENNYTTNTTRSVTFRSDSTTTFSAGSTEIPSTNIYLSSLLITVIIATLFTLLCLSLLALLSLSLLLLCRYLHKRSTIRRKPKRHPRVLYIDVMDDSYPLPVQHRDSNQYSDSSPQSDSPNNSLGITQALGVRVPVYERVQDLRHASEAAEQNPEPNTMNETSNTADNTD